MRAFPPSRARRSRARPSVSPLVGAAALLTAALLLVAQSAVATQSSYQITTLKQKQAQLLVEQGQLQSQLAQSRAANRVARGAEALGMTHPSRWQYLNATGSPIALAPRAGGAGGGGVVSGVLAVLTTLIGRPLEPQGQP